MKYLITMITICNISLISHAKDLTPDQIQMRNDARACIKEYINDDPDYKTGTAEYQRKALSLYQQACLIGSETDISISNTSDGNKIKKSEVYSVAPDGGRMGAR